MKRVFGNSIKTYFLAFKSLNPFVLIGATFLATVCGFLEGIGLSVFIPLLTPTDTSLSSSRFKGLVEYFNFFRLEENFLNVLLAMCLVFFLKGLLKILDFKVRSQIVSSFMQSAYGSLLKIFSKLDYIRFLERPQSEFSELMSSTVQNVSRSLTLLLALMSDLVAAFALFAIVLFVDPSVTLVIVLCGTFVFLAHRFINLKIAESSRNDAKQLILFNQDMVEAVNSFKYLKAAGLFRKFSERMKVPSARLAFAHKRMGTLSGIAMGMNQPILIVFFSVVMYVSMVIYDRPLADTLVVLMLVSRAISYALFAAGKWQNLTMSFGQVEVFSRWVNSYKNDLLDREECVFEETRELFINELAFKNLSFSFKGKTALNQLDFTIHRGEFVCLVGSSGSGKTTLLDLITGVYRPTSGDILVDRQPLSSEERVQWQQQIGVVLQDPPIFNGTLKFNLLLFNSNEVSEKTMIRFMGEVGLLEWFHTLPNGFETLMGFGGMSVSGGQRQRLALIRELLRGPKLLVLDEVTSALDPQSEVEIVDLLESLHKQGQTIVMSTHRVSALKKCDRIVVMKDGRIVESDTYENLTSQANSELRRLFEQIIVVG